MVNIQDNTQDNGLVDILASTAAADHTVVNTPETIQKHIQANTQKFGLV